MTDHDRALDTLAAHLDHLEAVVRGTAPGPVPAYRHDLSTLPEALRPRALALLDRARALEAEAARRLRDQGAAARAYGEAG